MISSSTATMQIQDGFPQLLLASAQLPRLSYGLFALSGLGLLVAVIVMGVNVKSYVFNRRVVPTGIIFPVYLLMLAGAIKMHERAEEENFFAPACSESVGIMASPYDGSLDPRIIDSIKNTCGEPAVSDALKRHDLAMSKH